MHSETWARVHLLMGDASAIMESNAHSEAKKCEAVKHCIHRESAAASGVSASALSKNVGSSGSSGRTCKPTYATSADKKAVVWTACDGAVHAWSEAHELLKAAFAHRLGAEWARAESTAGEHFPRRAGELGK
jgi:hypothetical protein